MTAEENILDIFIYIFAALRNLKYIQNLSVKTNLWQKILSPVNIYIIIIPSWLWQSVLCNLDMLFSCFLKQRGVIQDQTPY